MPSFEELLLKLEERFIMGEISEKVYLELKTKYEKMTKDGNISASGGVNLGDTGMIKDSHISSTTNIENKEYKGAPVVGGNQTINIGTKSSHVTKTGEKCPICGVIAKADYFICNECGKDYICQRHQDEETFLCYQCAEKIEKEKRKNDKIKSLLINGKACLGQNDFNKAIKAFEDILEIDVNNEEGIVLLSKAIAEKKRMLQLIREADERKREEAENRRREEEKRAAEERQNRIETLISKGKSWQDQDNIDDTIEAIKVLEDLLSMDPENKEGNILLEEAKVKKCKLDELKNEEDKRILKEEIKEIVKLTEENMVLIPEGEFLAGKTVSRGEIVNEGKFMPSHRVYLDAYWISKYCVTNREYIVFVKETGKKLDEYCENHLNEPAYFNWENADAYCDWLSRITGINYRLPTEAEWEKAARGGIEGGKYPWGDDEPDKTMANYGNKRAKYGDKRVGSTDVGDYSPNGFGLYDMAGNVCEFVADKYDNTSIIIGTEVEFYRKKRGPYANPKGTLSGKVGVCRGGDFESDQEDITVYKRNVYGRYEGLRLVVSAYTYSDISNANDGNKEGKQLYVKERKEKHDNEVFIKKTEEYRRKREIEEIINPVQENLVLIPAGEFRMGNPKWRAPSDERPQHKIFLDAYRIGKYPVTNKEYEKFLIATGWERPECWDIQDFNRPNRPVIRVRWYDAVAYCEWLAKISGKNYRLPTEAEWEKVARGGLEGKRYPWGNKKPDDKLINFERREAFLSLFNKNTDTYVGSYPPNEYGLYDMIGKVWQWVADWYDENYYKKSPDNNPQGPASGKYRVLRGGPCGGNLDGFRVTRRKWDEGGDKDEKLRCFGVLSKGFRIAISD